MINRTINMRIAFLLFLISISLTWSAVAQPDYFDRAGGMFISVGTHERAEAVRSRSINVSLGALGISAKEGSLGPRLLDVFAPDDVDISVQEQHRDEQDGWMYMSYIQTAGGVPIMDSYFSFTINASGNIISLGYNLFEPPVVVQKPVVVGVAPLMVVIGRHLQSLSVSILTEPEFVLMPIEGTDEIVGAWRLIADTGVSGEKVEFVLHAQNYQVLRAESQQRSEYGNNSSEQCLMACDTPLVAVGYFELSGEILVPFRANTPSDPISYANLHTAHIGIYNSVGAQVASFSSDATGHYYFNGNYATGNYFMRVPLRTPYFRGYYYENNLAVNTPIEDSYQFVSQGSHIYDHTWMNTGYEGDGANVIKHLSDIGDVFRSYPYNYSGIDYAMNVYVKQGSNINGRADGSIVEFGSQGGYEWALDRDVIYHEYMHNLIYRLYGNRFIGGSGFPQGYAMDEGIADYYSASIRGNASVGAGTRTLENQHEWTPSMGPHWNGQVIGGVLWRVRDALSLGQADYLLFRALRITPHARTFADLGHHLLLADQQIYGAANESAIVTAFDAHGIELSVPPPTVTLSGDTFLDPGQLGNWIATVSNGPAGDVRYEWYVSADGFNWTLHRDVTKSGLSDGFQWLGSSSYRVRVSVTRGGLSHSASVRVTVQDCDPSTDPTCIGIGGRIASLDKQLRVDVYPNPSVGDSFVNLYLPKTSVLTVHVADALGRQRQLGLPRQLVAGPHLIELDTSSWASGHYLLRFTFDFVENGSVVISRNFIVVQ